MRKIFILLINIIIVIVFLTGCSTLISREEIVVDVEIISTNHVPSWTETIVGDIVMINTYPDEYNVHIKYDEFNLSINDEDAYEICREREGKMVKVKIQVSKFEEGIIKYQLLSILK